jgi:hypothetical protein
MKKLPNGTYLLLVTICVMVSACGGGSERSHNTQPAGETPTPPEAIEAIWNEGNWGEVNWQ